MCFLFVNNILTPLGIFNAMIMALNNGSYFSFSLKGNLKFLYCLFCTSQKSLLHEESLFHVYKWIANDFSTKMYYELFLLSKFTENQDFPKI